MEGRLPYDVRMSLPPEGLRNMDAAAQRPERIGPYDIVETLTHGPRSRTYKGFDPSAQHTVALKTISRELLDSASRERLQTQVRAAARLSHSGIVKIIDYGEDSALAYVATEFVEGWPVRERCRIPMADAVALMVQVLEALDYAHAHGVVHRNLKPSNLLFTRNGLKIDGFGTAALDSRTPGYMSPEQLKDFAGDGRSDIFSAGIVFYELVTGASPFPGPPETLTERVCNHQERCPSEVDPNIPRVFDPICAKSLSKAAHDRYPSARAFCGAIRTAFESVHGSQPNQAMSHETVLLAVSAPESEGDQGSIWDEQTLRIVERKFASIIGPLAKIIVKRAANKAADLDQLYAILAESLRDQNERRAWLAQRSEITAAGARSKPQQASSQVRSSPPPASTAPIQRPVVAVPKPAAPTEMNPGPGATAAARPEPRVAPKPAPPPGVKPEPKVAPKPAAPPEVKLEPKVAPKPAPPPEVKPEPKVAPKPAPPPEVKHEPKPQPDAVVNRPSAPVPVASRFEELFGKQPKNLAGYLKDDPARLEDVIHAFATTANALARLHAAKARIEPLTPQSIRFDEVGRASIVSSQATATGSGGAVGNPRYAVPEIFAEKASGAESNLAASHVYALGFMFYEILIGRKLFEKTLPQQRTDLDWLRWHADLEAKLPASKSLLPGCPDALSDLLVSMTDKRWDKRADLQTICTTIRGIADRADQTVIMHAPTVRTPAAAAKPKAPVEPPLTPKKKSRKGLFILLVLLLALAAGALVLWQNPDLYRDVLSHFPHRAQTNRSAQAAQS